MLTLEHFVIRGQVLNLYRSIIRQTRGIGDVSSRQEAIEWLRYDLIDRHRHETDIERIKHLLSIAKREMKQFESNSMLVAGQHPVKFRGTRKQ